MGPSLAPHKPEPDPAVPRIACWQTQNCLVETHLARPKGGVDGQGQGQTEVVPPRQSSAAPLVQKPSGSILISGPDKDPSRSEEPRWISSPHAINQTIMPPMISEFSRPEWRVRDPGADNGTDGTRNGGFPGQLPLEGATSVAGRQAYMLHSNIGLGPLKIGSVVRWYTVKLKLASFGTAKQVTFA